MSKNKLRFVRMRMVRWLGKLWGWRESTGRELMVLRHMICPTYKTLTLMEINNKWALEACKRCMTRMHQGVRVQLEKKKQTPINQKDFTCSKKSENRFKTWILRGFTVVLMPTLKVKWSWLKSRNSWKRQDSSSLRKEKSVPRKRCKRSLKESIVKNWNNNKSSRSNTTRNQKFSEYSKSIKLLKSNH
jgi:pterin-4a-carbinolamine dehydratase